MNVTDPDSRNLKTTRGWVQGYNAQAVVIEDQIVIAAKISTESLDTANLRPMITAAEEELHAAGVIGRLDVVLADAGYWTNNAIERSPPRACDRSCRRAVAASPAGADPR
jgi:hypothetical protein